MFSTDVGQDGAAPLQESLIVSTVLEANYSLYVLLFDAAFLVLISIQYEYISVELVKRFATANEYLAFRECTYNWAHPAGEDFFRLLNLFPVRIAIEFEYLNAGEVLVVVFASEDCENISRDSAAMTGSFCLHGSVFPSGEPHGAWPDTELKH